MNQERATVSQPPSQRQDRNLPPNRACDPAAAGPPDRMSNGIVESIDRSAVTRCEECGRVLKIRVSKNGRVSLPGHYNPENPPTYGEWAYCPGPRRSG